MFESMNQLTGKEILEAQELSFGVSIPVMTCLPARTDLIQPCKVVTIAQSSTARLRRRTRAIYRWFFRLAFATANTGTQLSVSLMESRLYF